MYLRTNMPYFGGDHEASRQSSKKSLHVYGKVAESGRTGWATKLQNEKQTGIEEEHTPNKFSCATKNYQERGKEVDDLVENKTDYHLFALSASCRQELMAR